MQDAPIPKEASLKVEEEAAATDPLSSEALQLPYEQSLNKVRESALRQLNRLMSYEANVLKGDDTEAIHDMRVATRRLQQVLDLLYPKPRPAEVRRLRRQIRRCRQVLGEVRNCDVLLEIVGRPLRQKRSGRRDTWGAVQHFISMRRSEASLQATRRLGKINLAALYVDLKELLRRTKGHGPSSPSATPSPGAGRSLARDLGVALESTWSRFEGQIEHSHRDAQPEAIHGARIATKRLRYLLEVFHEFGVAGSADALGWLRQLQKDLGDWHDLVVLEEMMIEMLARKGFLRDHLSLAMDVGKLILRNRANKVGFEEKYFRISRGSEEIQRLKDWVAYLLTSPSAAPLRA